MVKQLVQYVHGFLLWMLFGRSPLPPQCVDLDVRLYYAAIQNLVCACGNIPQTNAESSDTPSTHGAQHVQQSLDMSIQFPAGLQCDHVQMAEVAHQESVLDGGAWLYRYRHRF